MTARNTSETARVIPEATVARLPVYHRALPERWRTPGVPTSSERGPRDRRRRERAKVRKDLSYLGSYGTRGVGYDVDYLRYEIARGSASPATGRSSSSGSEISVVPSRTTRASGPWLSGRGFDRRRPGAGPGDRSAAVASAQSTTSGDRPQALHRHWHPRHPGGAAQDVADRIVDGRCDRIVNFAPAVSIGAGGRRRRKVDLSIELQILAYHEQRKAHEHARDEIAAAAAAVGGES